ncbi:hypothetical protein FRC02_010833 [Tulasnella sp. 418]|nr:hypothetical protein FRC02_010833 [Tulasnella sp. 418]
MQIAEHLSFTHQPPQIFSMGIATRSSRFRAVESSKAPPPSFIAQYSVDNAADIRPTVSAVITGNEDDRDESDENDDEYQEEKNEEKMEKVKEMAGLQRRNVDDDNSFWQTYVSESGKFDKEMIDTWNENLDSLLLFATLFSAINTSFIIETYKRLQPDAIESTNSLLKLMLQHRNDDQKIDLEDQHWTPPFAAVRTNTMLFASLTSSVLAAFGAILGKEMLAEYKSAGALNTIPEQGRQRQKKFDALVRYRFRLLMQVLPIMLQLSLALFLLGVIDFLLPMSRAVATVIFVPASFGFILYIVSLVVAIKREDAPFQTSVSKSCRSLLRRVGHVRPGAIRDGIHRSIESVWRQLQLSLSKLDPIFQFLSATSVSPAVQRGSRKLYSAFHSSVLDMLGWWRRVWDKLDTVVSVTLYIGVLGVMGWFIMGWEALLSALGASEWTAAQALVENERDAISGDCAMWLLENSHDTKVIRETLEYIPFLPADILFRRFRAQPKILERYILMYKSTLQPQAGDMSLYLDEETQKDSIICGRALFHVLKLREEEDRKRIAFTTGGNSELLEVLGSETDVSDKFDLSLLTVFHCILTQSEGKDITERNFRFLYILLKRYLDKLQKRSAGDPLCASSSSSQNQSSTTTTLTLLLDSGIFLVSQRHPINHYPVGCECDDKLEGVLEDILATVHEILGDQPMSMSLSSHVALLIAAIQWFKHKAGEVSQTTQGETLGFNGVKLVHIRKAWLAPDTRADFFDNVILAFKLIGSNNSAATKSLYLDLLTFTENFMPRVMDVSRGNDEWNVWFAKMIQIIPGMLQLLRQVQSEEHVREGYPSAIRILSRLLPDDWTPKDVKEILRKHEYAKLHILSPLRREYGAIMVRLVSFFLSSKATIPVSALTRRSIAEVLGWMVVCSRNLPLLIKQTTLYQQSTSVPSFLLSVMEGAEAPIGLVELCNYHLTLLLEMSPEELAPNLMHAFNRLSLGDSNATIDLYLELLDHTEELDVPRTSIEWSLKVIQLIPAFLRLLRDFKENPEAGYSTIRVISCLLPTDWSPKAMRNLKMRDSERQLQVLSPLHPVYGNDIIDLINLILSPHTTSSPSPNTRRSLGEVLGWMAIAAASTGKLRSLIDSSIGLYQQPTTTIPVFLASLMSEKESSPHLVRLCGYHLQLLLEMPSQQLSSVQSEALVIALTNESIAKITFPGIVTLIDGLTQSDPDISWPTSFVKFKIVEWAEGSSQGKVLRFAKKRPMRDFFKEASVTWRGEGLLILWRTLLVQKDVDMEDHPHIFREEVIQTVLDCFNEAVSRNCQVSCPTMEDYLEKALQYGRLKDEMKVNIKKAMGDLNRVVKQGWNAIVRKDNPEGVNAKKSQRWSWPDEV